MPPTKSPEPSTFGSMGLRGLWGLVGNATAMLVIAVAFLWAWRDGIQQAHEDRQMFREMSDRQWQELRKLTDGIEKLANEVRDMGQRDRKKRAEEVREKQ